MNRHHQLETGSDRIAVLTIDMAEKNANVLSTELVEELIHTLQRLHAMKEVAGLLIRSGKKKQFIAGANIDEIVAIADPALGSEKSRLGQELMKLIETLRFPSVAAIDGPCLGGGLELALACTYRVAGEGVHVRLALPEVKLGIIPGWGGTQRLPKLIGLLPALDLIVSGKTLDTRRAYKLGLVDDYAASEILEDVAREWLTGKKKVRRPRNLPVWQKLAELLPAARKMIFKQARNKVIDATGGNYPAPFAAIEVLEQTYRSSDSYTYELEAKKVGELVTSPVSKALIGLFQATEEIRHTQLAVPPKPVKKVGVLGAGVMGGGIAHILASKGKSVRLRDINHEAMAKGMQTAQQLVQKDIAKRRLDKREASQLLSRIAPSVELSGFRFADVVIEAVVEKIEIKKRVLTEIAKYVSSEAVLATNTSALSITGIASVIPNPERVIGLHFFNPVHKMPLVEIIRGEQTSDQALSTTFALALTLGKTPIVVADRPGFLVNRILGLYLNEASRAAEEGISPALIEKVTKRFGLPMGPFELMDEIGLDIADHVGAHLCQSFSHFPKPSPLVTRLLKDGRLGKKNGKGFYIHKRRGKTLDESYLNKILKITKQEEVTSEVVEDRSALLADRMILLMVNEAARCLETKVVASARDVDIGMVLGTGFAPFRGGPLAYANARGLKDVASRLNHLAEAHGEHFKPTAYLEDFAQRDGKF